MKRRRRLLWRLYASYLVLVVLSLLANAWYATRFLSRSYLHEEARNLEVRARLLIATLGDSFTAGDAARIGSACREAGRAVGTRFTVVLPSGEVAADSDHEPATMDNHAGRPEVRTALAGDVGLSTRFSDTVKKEMVYVAVPVLQGGRVVAVVRASTPVPEIDRALRAMYVEIAAGGAVIAALGAVLVFLVSRWITAPLVRMQRGAEQYAQGNLAYRMAVPDLAETGALAESMNRMAEELDARIRTITRQRNELEAVLSAMVEAVLVVDERRRLVRMNAAAARLLGVETERVEGREIGAVFSHPELESFVRELFACGHAAERDMTFGPRGAERHLQAHGTFLRDAAGASIGALVVLNDVTRLKRLETVRRDFVANVSHELKTPITTILGFVETLREGAIAEPETARGFLEIIARHSERLSAIIEDLLALSRIEQDEGQEIPLTEERIRTVLEGAIQVCRAKAAERGVRIELDCEADPVCRINPPLLEHAVANLIDNAVKYSEPGGVVRIVATPENGGLAVRVQDTGCGIPAEHLPRIFERFYRVDKARSRAMGGTGLGLAIVKHIMTAHRGRVTVESEPGRGSIFTLHLPGR